MSAPVRDWSLNSGERQTASSFSEVRANHRARYEYAAREIGKCSGKGLDLFCGTGYGTALLARECGCSVLGIDGSAESIDFARVHFPGEYEYRQFPFALEPNAYDFIVSFESLEHVKDDALMAGEIIGALRDGGRLIISVPNEAKLPHATFRNRFHVRHYTRNEILALFSCLTLDAWFGQNVKDYERGQRFDESEMGLLPETEGQSLVFAFTKRVH